MGDVTTLPPSSSGLSFEKAVKTVGVDEYDVEASLSGVGGGGSGDAPLEKPQKPTGGAGGSGFPIKALYSASSSLPGQRQADSDTETPPRPGHAVSRGGKGVPVIISAASGADTDADSPPRQERRQQRQQAAGFQQSEIRRTTSTADSVLDAWAPSNAPGGSAHSKQKEHSLDPAASSADEQATLRLSMGRPASKRLSLSRIFSMFSSAHSPSASIIETPAATGGTTAEIVSARVEKNKSDGGDGDSANAPAKPPLKEVPEGAETLRLERPVSKRGSIPAFAVIPARGVQAPGGASVANSSSTDEEADGAPASIVGSSRRRRPGAFTVDITKPISLDDLRLVEDGDGDGAARDGGIVVKVSEAGGPASMVTPPPKAATGSNDTTPGISSEEGSQDGSRSNNGDVDVGEGGAAAAAASLPPSASGDDCADPNNASLWARAAAVSAAATAEADSAAAQSNPFGSNSWVPGYRRSASMELLSSGAKTLRRLSSGIGSARMYNSNGAVRRSVDLSAPRQRPPSPHAGVAAVSSGSTATLPELPPSSSSSHQYPHKPTPTAFPHVESLHKLEAGDSSVSSGGLGKGEGYLVKTPMMSPFASSDTDVDDGTSSWTGSESSPGGSGPAAATARAEVEGDIETGGAVATVGAGARAAVAASATTTATGVPEVDAAVAASAAEGGVEVLPCAPSEEEKVLYRSTGRFVLVSCALVSFTALTWGMWLFTIYTPIFYWFGVPAIFIIFYTACHYLGIAIWGKDFSLDEHAEVLRKSREKGYEPPIDIFLPVCKEPLHLLANTWKYVAALDYPSVKVYVLDDGKSEDVRALATSFGFEYVLRSNAPALKKAGNLRNAFGITSGEAIAIFDADFCPRADFLKDTVPYLGEDPTIGIVQTPQYFRHREEQTWIEQGAGVTQEFFYRLVQVNQDRFNASVCVGSCGLYRRDALEPLGGMAAIEHSEDMYTGYKMTEYGYKIKYVPLNLAMGICPDDPQSFFMQQYRWCKGSATLVAEKEFWQSGISNLHKLCFLNGMMYYMATALLIFVAPLPIMLLVWAKADGVLWYHSAFVVPSLILVGIVMPLWSKQKYGMSSNRVKVLQCYAHLYAIKDTIMNTHAPWIPSGAGNKKISGTYRSSVRLMVTWNIFITAMIVGGSAWRMTMLTWYHFAPAMALAIGSFVLNMSTLIY